MIFPRASPGGFFPLHRTELPARPAPPPATSGTAFPAAHCANVTFQQSHSYGRKPWGLGCCQERSRLGAGRQPVNQSRLTAKHTSWATDFCSRSLALSLASPCLHRSCSAAFCQPFCLPLLFLLLGCPAGFAPCCAWGQLPAWGSCCAWGPKGCLVGLPPVVTAPTGPPADSTYNHTSAPYPSPYGSAVLMVLACLMETHCAYGVWGHGVWGYSRTPSPPQAQGTPSLVLQATLGKCLACLQFTITTKRELFYELRQHGRILLGSYLSFLHLHLHLCPGKTQQRARGEETPPSLSPCNGLCIFCIWFLPGLETRKCCIVVCLFLCCFQPSWKQEVSENGGVGVKKKKKRKRKKEKGIDLAGIHLPAKSTEPGMLAPCSSQPIPSCPNGFGDAAQSMAPLLASKPSLHLFHLFLWLRIVREQMAIFSSVSVIRSRSPRQGWLTQTRPPCKAIIWSFHLPSHCVWCGFQPAPWGRAGRHGPTRSSP